MQYTSAETASNALAEHLRRLHTEFAGAQFRIAFYKRGDDWEFLTGSIIFQPQRVASRPRSDYGYVLFVEEWSPSQWEAHRLMAKLLNGEAEIDGYKIKGSFANSRFERHIYPRSDRRWSGLQIVSSRDRNGPYQEVYLPQDPIATVGLKPYWGANHAINEWLFDAQSTSPASNSVPHSNELVTILPDTRARIVAARWTPGKLRIKTEINTQAEVQMQILQLGSEQDHQLLDGKQDGDIPIPNDTRDLLIYLVHQDDGCITQAQMHSMYRGFGDFEQEETVLDRTLMELGRGENEQVEYKPFLSPNHEKEMEFVETAIAFANTSGGTIYVGVRDRDGSPYGVASLRKLFPNEANPVDQQAARLQWLVTNKIKPIPSFKVEKLYPWGEPVVSVSIQGGRETPYATHENEMFIRRASTNYRPDPTELKELMSHRSSVLGSFDL